MPSDKVHTAFKSDNKSINARWAVESGVERTLDTGAKVDTDICYLRFYIPESMGPPVLFYYYLTNFYQNHRRYVDSFNSEQLRGKYKSYDEIHDSDCTPLYGEKDQNLPYFPCGLIANSMFNDTYSAPKLISFPGQDGNETRTYDMKTTGIAWESDRELYDNTVYKYDQCLPPPNWHDRYPDGYTEEMPPPKLKDWEAFHVWMRTAGLPTFSKLYQRNDTAAMEEGEYEIKIDDCAWKLPPFPFTTGSCSTDFCFFSF